MKADARTKAAVLALLQEFADGYTRCDAQRVMLLYASDPDIVVIADGLKYVGQEQIRTMVESDLSSFDAIMWAFAAPSVSSAGPVAWVTTDAMATGKTGGQSLSLGAYHFTWVLEQREEQWFIVHLHISAVTSEI
jgi:uncharacterized protein (TIGR02246 family)